MAPGAERLAGANEVQSGNPRAALSFRSRWPGFNKNRWNIDVNQRARQKTLLVGGVSKQPNSLTTICPACGGHMKHVRTVWRWPEDDQLVFECKPCGVSLTQAQVPKDGKAT